MTDKKISQLTNITGAELADSDEFVVARASTSENFAVTKAELYGSLPPVSLSYSDLVASTEYTYSTGSAYSVVAGSVIGTTDGGFWEVAASNASDHHATTAGGVKLYEAGSDFSSRERLVAAHDRNVAAGRTVSSGTVWSWPDFSIVLMPAGHAAYGTDPIADLAGWSPTGPLYPDHFDENTTPGTTDMTSAVSAAVAYAVTSGVPVHADVDYLTTSSIDDIHSVEWVGAGKIIRGSNEFEPGQRTSQATTIYVNASSGDDTNDGLGTAQALETIQQAIDILKGLTPLRSTFTIELAAGTYDPAVITGDFVTTTLTIKGPDTTIAWDRSLWEADAGTDRTDMTPTAIISGAGIGDSGTGLDIGTMRRLDLEDLKFTEFRAGTGINATSVGLVNLDNVHVSRCPIAGKFQTGTTYSWVGGYLDGDDPASPGTPLTNAGGQSYGCHELFGSVRNFKRAGSADAAPLIENFEIGLFAKELCTGHGRYLKINNCTEVAADITRCSTINAGNMVLHNSPIGILLSGSSSFEDNGVTDYGLGTANACDASVVYQNGADRYLRLAASNEPTRAGLQNTLMGFIGEQSAHTGTTTSTKIGGDLYTQEEGQFSVKGSGTTLTVWGDASLTTATATIRYGVGGSSFLSVVLPIGTTKFRVTFHMRVTSDGDTQEIFADGYATVSGTNQVVVGNGSRTFNLRTTTFDHFVQVQLGDTGDSVTVVQADLWGTQL